MCEKKIEPIYVNILLTWRRRAMSEGKIPFDKLMIAYEVLTDIFGIEGDGGGGMSGWDQMSRREASANGRRVISGYALWNYPAHCSECGTRIDLLGNQYRRNRRYCSDACRQKAWRGRHSRHKSGTPSEIGSQDHEK